MIAIHPETIDPASVPALKWGVIGPGGIAKTFIDAVQKHTKQQIVAVASKTPGRAQAVADEFDIPIALDDYAALVSHPEVQAVYIATHIKDHYEHAMLAINAGKHVLVEKPITYLPSEAESLLGAAKAKGLLAMEAMWTRYLPQSYAIRSLIQGGELGAPQLLTAAFCTDNRAVERLWQKGSGGIVYDMGIYPIAIAQQFLGNPIKIHATGKLDQNGMDQESYITMEYEGGARAQLTISGISSLPITANCSFENGLIVIDEPFLAPGGLSVRDKEFYFEEQHWIDTSEIQGHEGLSYQATAFASYVSKGFSESPVHSHRDTVANIRTAQAICELIGAKPF